MGMIELFKWLNKVFWLYVFVVQSIVKTTLKHFLYPGPPLKSWAYPFHVVIDLLRNSTTSFEVGTPLGKLRNLVDNKYNSPPKEFRMLVKVVPDQFREQAHQMVKARMQLDLGFSLPPVRDTHWPHAPPLEIELAMPDGKPFSRSRNVILMAHGGAYIFGSLNSYRAMACRVAKATKETSLSIGYRLSPENPFPCALEDVTAAYLFLTSREGMNVASNQVVVCGESAGGGLIASMLTLLETNPSVGAPCGGLLLSPWVDLTSCLPSYTENSKGDYIPGPDLINKLNLPKSATENLKTYSYATHLLAKSCPDLESELLRDRGHFYAPESLLNYPLISPMNTKSFSRFPPMMMVAGKAERLRDECIVLACRLHQDHLGKLRVPLPVTLQIFDDMPHAFLSFLFHPSATRSLEWSCNFIKRCLTSDQSRVDDSLPISDRTIDPKGPWAWRIDSKLVSHPIMEHSEFDYLTEFIKR